MCVVFCFFALVVLRVQTHDLLSPCFYFLSSLFPLLVFRCLEKEKKTKRTWIVCATRCCVTFTSIFMHIDRALSHCDSHRQRRGSVHDQRSRHYANKTGMQMCTLSLLIPTSICNSHTLSLFASPCTCWCCLSVSLCPSPPQPSPPFSLVSILHPPLHPTSTYIETASFFFLSFFTLTTHRDSCLPSTSKPHTCTHAPLPPCAYA